MNIKRFFGAILTLLGIVGLIYRSNMFFNTTGGNHDVRILILYGALGFLFFITGVNWILTTKDASI